MSLLSRLSNYCSEEAGIFYIWAASGELFMSIFRAIGIQISLMLLRDLENIESSEIFNSGIRIHFIYHNKLNRKQIKIKH
jgi:hypothetical protein